ncbi:hypothetical protein FRB95_005228 [Tulasnella sp. JGI-2019a]|nr:hypothetical protein FRB93_006193 [Tulasnella sp. JGI-2019a]KAG9020032.1 hypothetical protein FRB95_005228 [Tulasnella sp. JGI-2019a]
MEPLELDLPNIYSFKLKGVYGKAKELTVELTTLVLDVSWLLARIKSLTMDDAHIPISEGKA